MVDKGRPSIPTGRVSRALPIAQLASASTLTRVAGWVRRGGDAKELVRFTKDAQRLAQTLGEMKGAAMKVGQLLSFVDSNLIPEAYRPIYHEIVGSLQADAPPVPTPAIKAVIEEELGRPVDELFEWFGEQPMAAASIGQVHAAHLPGGREVVVKVQYPGAAEAVRNDLANAELLASIGAQMSRVLGPLRPLSDPRAIVEEIRDRVSEELDYRIEADNLELFGDHYRDHPFIRIPTVVRELSTERVLVMDEADGLRYSAALQQPQALRDTWGEVINRFVWGSFYDLCAFNADPHPGNYLFHDDGGVTFLDFGCVRRWAEEDMDLFRELDRVAFADGDTVDVDADAFLDVLQQLGFLGADTSLAPERVLDWYRPMWEPVTGEQPFTFTPEFAAAIVERTFDPLGEFGDVVRGISIGEQAKRYTFLTRIQLGLWSVLGALGTTGPWRAIHHELTFGDEPATELGRAHAAWRRSRTAAGGDLPSS